MRVRSDVRACTCAEAAVGGGCCVSSCATATGACLVCVCACACSEQRESQIGGLCYSEGNYSPRVVALAGSPSADSYELQYKTAQGPIDTPRSLNCSDRLISVGSNTTPDGTEADAAARGGRASVARAVTHRISLVRMVRMRLVAVCGAPYFHAELFPWSQHTLKTLYGFLSEPTR